MNAIEIPDRTDLRRTILKILAIAAVLAAAPLMWLDLVDAMLHPIGGPPPLFAKSEYLIAYVLTLLSIIVVPFLRTNLLRALFTVLMLAAIAFDQAVVALSGAHINQDLINLLWQLRDNAGDSLSFSPQIVWHVVWLLPVALIFLLKPRGLSLTSAFAIIPISALAITYHNVQIANSQKVTHPPVFAIEGQIVKAIRVADPKTDPPKDVAYTGTIAPRIKNIVYIVDESVSASFMSLYNPRFDNTPFLSGLVGKSNFFNFGPASSIANCSTATRLVMRVGGRRQMLPDTSHHLLEAPNFWLYAHKAGYRTIYFDSFRTSLTYHSYMGSKEAGQIDERFALAAIGDDRTRDHDIAHRLIEMLDDPESQFIFVEKQGAHYPHIGRVLPDDFSYRPKGVETYADRLELTTGQKARVADYLQEINWQVDDFFKVLQPALDRPDTVVIYTSDHGQNMFESPSKFFHCNSIKPALTEGVVPLFVATGNAEIARDLASTLDQHFGRSSHFEIFPTLLDWMGYDKEFVADRYGAKLYGPAPVAPRKFLARDPFRGKWFAVDGGVLPDDDNLLGKAWYSWPDKRPDVNKSPSALRAAPFCSFDVALGPQQNFALRSLQPVPKGATVTAGLWLWADVPITLALSVARQGRNAWEASSKAIQIDPTPTFYRVSHTFKSDHKGWRLQLRNYGSGTIKFRACQARTADDEGPLAELIAPPPGAMNRPPQKIAGGQ
jgi:glucan phosphoethanolaminetransferase (alkaline phosphatase superfamily)